MICQCFRKTHTSRAQSPPTVNNELITSSKQLTRMNDEDILYWFQTFHRDCPDGLLTQQVFIQFYKQAFHDGDPRKFCKRVFHIFDRDKSGRSCSSLDRFYKLVFLLLQVQ